MYTRYMLFIPSIIHYRLLLPLQSHHNHLHHYQNNPPLNIISFHFKPGQYRNRLLRGLRLDQHLELLAQVHRHHHY
jgi:hypothetical protein